MQKEFVHLNIHTEFSLKDGICDIKEIVNRAKKDRSKAVALTDVNNICGMVKFYKLCIENKIKPLVGADLFFYNENFSFSYRLTLICKNNIGFKNLSKIITLIKLKETINSNEKLINNKNILVNKTEGLIAISSMINGDVIQLANRSEFSQAFYECKIWQKLFPHNFYLSVSRLGYIKEEIIMNYVTNLAVRSNVPIVALNEIRFIESKDFMTHEIRVGIQRGTLLKNRDFFFSQEQYFKSKEDMVDLFKDIPECVLNTVEISKKCNYQVNMSNLFLPILRLKNDEDLDSNLIYKCKKGLVSRNLHKRQEYVDRLDKELNVITKMGFSSYFLIVSDFMRWTKNRKIPVGPGRGSGAGSLVSFVMSITDIDPIKYRLLFERFLNNKRVSMPDFDIDFCTVKRDDVVDYMRNRYGKKSVAQIITFSTMNAKSSVRDIGRALGYSYSFVDKIAKLIPFKIGTTLKNSLRTIKPLQKLYKENSEIKKLIEYGLRLEGITKNVGKHAGGIVISPAKIIDFSPVFFESGSDFPITQLDKNDSESVGLVKFDFLSLKTLSIIKWCVQSINKSIVTNKKLMNIQNLPLYNKNTYDLLKTGNTTGIFQLESFGIKKMLNRLEPDDFNHVIALGALYRPGPLKSGMVTNFIKGRHDKVKIRYVHKYLKSVLSITYGIVLYQEQVMEIAQFLAGYDLGEADLLRRAMGKKQSVEMYKHRLIFVERLSRYNVKKHVAGDIFDLMDKFSGYGFNRSHSTCYGMITYQTAYLKGNYKIYYMASHLSADMLNHTKMKELIYDCKINNRIRVAPPCINTSTFNFSVKNKNIILYGLGAVKGLSKHLIINIIRERRKSNYKSLFDFCFRVDIKNISKKIIENLVFSGCFDRFDSDRYRLLTSVKETIKMAKHLKLGMEQGQFNLFDLGDVKVNSVPGSRKKFFAKYNEKSKLYYEKQNLGSYVSSHPVSMMYPILKEILSSYINYTPILEKKHHVFLGLLLRIRPFFTIRNELVLLLKMEDQFGHVDVILKSNVYKLIKNAIYRNVIYLVKGSIKFNDNCEAQIEADKMVNFDHIINNRIKYIKLLILEKQLLVKNIRHFFLLLKKQEKGSCPIMVNIRYDKKKLYKKCMGKKWSIEIDGNILVNIRKIFGKNSLEIIYF